MAKPELLAPAGSREALVAAVQNGADAVYLGGRRFNARSSADNFSDRELAEVIDYAHARDVKVFVTVNILLADSELSEAVDFLQTIYNAGADAAIVQDLGLIKLARQVIPELKLHASTQMTAHNATGVKFLHDMGISRVVLARELDLKSIRAIKDSTGVPLEVFIHGALCICYSGQCLMSSMIGGRSGNRGRCAQPCRLPYQLLNAKNKPMVDTSAVGEYLLSPRDLNLSHYLPQLIAAGIDSFKIEGRMRRPEYVATVTRIYRQLIDRALSGENYTVTDEEVAELTQIFNRDFSTGYFFDVPNQNLMSYKRPNNRGTRLGRISGYRRENSMAEIELEAPLAVGDGIEVWVTKGGRVGVTVTQIQQKGGKKISYAPAGIVVLLKINGHIRAGDRVFKTHDGGLMEKALATFTSQRENLELPLSFKVSAQVGQPMVLKATDDQGLMVVAQTDALGEVALHKPLTADFLKEQLARLGNTPFKLQQLECDLGDQVSLPVREINLVRRRAVEMLLARRLDLYRRIPTASVKPPRDQILAAVEQRRLFNPPRLAVAVSTADAAKVAVQNGADIIYFGGDFYRCHGQVGVAQIEQAREFCSRHQVDFYLATPRLLHDHELEKYLKFLQKALTVQPDGMLLTGYGLIKPVQSLTAVPLVADWQFNIFNRHSALFLKQQHLRRVTLSLELTGEQISLLAGYVDTDTEVIVHGVLPLMVTRYCGLGSLLGGRKNNQACRVPCAGDTFLLRDRKGVVFPVETDANCYMHIFNSRPLCLLETLPTLVQTGVGVLRIEARLEDADNLQQIVAAYRRTMDMLQNNPDQIEDLTPIRQQLMDQTAGFTRGHYYRGVLD